jgi:hypothetical protein
MRTPSTPIQRARSAVRLHSLLADQRGSAAVEYVGLALVVSALLGSVAGAVDSALGERLARAIVHRLLDRVGR